ncbi:MAG: type III pantothenate kinase [Desulfovibrio sp.]|nr:type III pantothenate kinase [Desulfovibrio sp.]
MHAVLLADIGNSQLGISLATQTSRLATIHLPSATESAVIQDAITSMLSAAKAHVSCAYISSVVPEVAKRFTSLCSEAFGCQTLFVPKDIPIPLASTYQSKGLGSDRLLACYAAKTHAPKAQACIVVDMGTAITIDVLKEDTFLGGFILPGPKLFAKVLHDETAQLPLVEPTVMETFQIGQSTETCIRYGISLGVIAMLSGLIARTKAWIRVPSVVIATGGFAQAFGQQEFFDAVYPDLVLDGLFSCIQACTRTTIS